MMMTYTICKVMFKGDVREISSASSSSSHGSGIEQSRPSLIPLLENNSEVGQSRNFLCLFLSFKSDNDLFCVLPFFRDRPFTAKSYRIQVRLVMCSKKLKSRMLYRERNGKHG